MMTTLKNAWVQMIRPLLRRPDRIQVAALCWRDEDDRILLITSRDTGRWILPKGWPIDGLDAGGAAMQEAWEEAGVQEADTSPRPIGQYVYRKALEGGVPVRVVTQVHPVRVTRMADDYPEASERTRRWVTPQEAAGMVDEPGLQEILRNFRKPEAKRP